MKRALMVCAAALWIAAPAFAVEKTLNGTISDSNCGAKHAAAEEHGAKMSKSDCVKACVDKHDAKYVLVSEGKTYKIENQDFAGLKTHAGHNVALTGEVKGDTVTVSKIEMPSKSTEKK